MKRIFKLYSNGRKNKTFLTQSIILVKLNMYNDYALCKKCFILPSIAIKLKYSFHKSDSLSSDNLF